jgi:hypothetical protein
VSDPMLCTVCDHRGADVRYQRDRHSEQWDINAECANASGVIKRPLRAPAGPDVSGGG